MTASYHSEYARLFGPQPEGMALYKVDTTMKPGDIGYFDSFGTWQRLQDDLDGIQVIQDPTIHYWAPKISSEQKGGTFSFRSGVDATAATAVPAKAMADVVFHSGRQKTAICVAEPVTTFRLQDIRPVRHWITNNKAILEDFKNQSDDHTLWVVKATHTTTRAAIAILDSNQSIHLASVKAGGAKIADLDLSQSSWKEMRGGAAEIAENPDGMVVFFEGYHITDYRRPKTLWKREIALGKDPMGQWVHDNRKSRGTHETEEPSSYVADTTSSAVEVAEEQVGEATKKARVMVDIGDEHHLEYEVWGTADKESDSLFETGKYNSATNQVVLSKEGIPKMPNFAVGRALLIGSSYGGLLGTRNDVNKMAGLLESLGFHKIRKLTEERASRQNILETWKEIICESSENDAVVIYYSGHGGYAKPRLEADQKKEQLHFQYWLPSDFDGTLREWKGILDIEISQLLLSTTAKTKNVTYILDCCHSARLGRAPKGKGYRSKAVRTIRLERSYFMQILNDAKTPDETLSPAGKLDFTGENDYTNPNVVRIAAAAADNAAWEHEDGSGNSVGMLTEHLVKILPSLGSTSWRNIMLAVRSRVKNQFTSDPQQPRSAGADRRIPFSNTENLLRPLLAEIRGNGTLIEGGQVLGVRIGDKYNLTTLEEPPNLSKQYTVEVKSVMGFTSRASLVLSDDNVDCVQAFAYLIEKSSRWPMAVQDSLENIGKLLQQSPKFRSAKPDEDCVIELRQEEDRIVVYGRGDDGALRLHAQLSTDPTAIDDLLEFAETFSRARDIILLENGTGNESFRPNVQIKIGLVDSEGSISEVLGTFDSRYDVTSHTLKSLLNVPNSSTSSLQSDRPFHLTENQRFYIDLSNNSKDESSRVYISVLAVYATGRIDVLSSKAWEKGILLTFEDYNTSLKRDHKGQDGLQIQWPEPILKVQPVYEYFVFVITKQEVDLRFLEAAPIGLERVARGEDERGFSLPTEIPYHIIKVRYLLHPH